MEFAPSILINPPSLHQWIDLTRSLRWVAVSLVVTTGWGTNHQKKTWRFRKGAQQFQTSTKKNAASIGICKMYMSYFGEKVCPHVLQKEQSDCKITGWSPKNTKQSTLPETKQSPWNLPWGPAYFHGLCCSFQGGGSTTWHVWNSIQNKVILTNINCWAGFLEPSTVSNPEDVGRFCSSNLGHEKLYKGFSGLPHPKCLMRWWHPLSWQQKSWVMRGMVDGDFVCWVVKSEIWTPVNSIS